jgi:hypothetical protein
VNPDVTQANLATTICRSGWTGTVRPPVGYTEPLKLQLMTSYGRAGGPARYELDHLIPLELGGAPRFVSNLWPEVRSSANVKDMVENAANRAVCSGKMTLADAQQRIRTDWVALGRDLGLSMPS